VRRQNSDPHSEPSKERSRLNSSTTPGEQIIQSGGIDRHLLLHGTQNNDPPARFQGLRTGCQLLALAMVKELQHGCPKASVRANCELIGSWLKNVDIRQTGLGRDCDCIDHAVEYTVTPLPTNLLNPCVRCCSGIEACWCVSCRTLRLLRSTCASWYFGGEHGTPSRAGCDQIPRCSDRPQSEPWTSVVGSG